MDPFVVVSFSKKIFRTRVIRHSLNPTWDEKLLFHVRRYEITFPVHFAVLDLDKLSSNDHVGDGSLPRARLLERAPRKDGETGLYGEEGEVSIPLDDWFRDDRPYAFDDVDNHVRLLTLSNSHN